MPFLFSFHPALRFHKTWKAFFRANLTVGLLFVIWDVAFTHLGVWGFNTDYVCGIYVFNLPLEEILFFICIPFASLFTYHCMKYFFQIVRIPSRNISVFLTIVLFVVGFLSVPKLYTAVTFLSLAIFLTGLIRYLKPQWLAHFYLSYALILIPFTLVNGLLTGSWINEPIVWYNDAENLGIRMLTIPIEDVFYGFLLLLLNTWLYERYLQKQKA